MAVPAGFGICALFMWLCDICNELMGVSRQTEEDEEGDSSCSGTGSKAAAASNDSSTAEPTPNSNPKTTENQVSVMAVVSQETD